MLWDVPDGIRAQFEKAISGTAGDEEVEVTRDDAQSDDVVPFISDEILMGYDDYESQILEPR